MAIITISGNTSGSISLSAPDISGSNTLTLPVATDTLIGKATTDTLTNKSIAASQLTGTIAASALPAGSVLQVVNGTTSTYTTSATSTFANTSLTATITPTSNTSKILILMSHAGCGKATNNTALQIKVLRGATQIVYLEDIGGSTGSTAENYIGSISVNYLDSPATTSATTYKSQMASRASNATVYVNGYGSVQVTSTITLMEIAG
jgi:hypothetical protein